MSKFNLLKNIYFHIKIHEYFENFLFRFLSYRKVSYSEVRNDTEVNTRYVRVLDPKAAEISFVRTTCEKKQALYVSCANLGLYCSKQKWLAAK